MGTASPWRIFTAHGLLIGRDACFRRAGCAALVRVAVEVSHRARRRLFGLAALAPLRDGVAPPLGPNRIAAAAGRRPVCPRRRAWRYRLCRRSPRSSTEHRAFDDSGLEGKAFTDDAIRQARRALHTLAQPAALAPPGTDGARVGGPMKRDIPPVRSVEPPAGGVE